MDLFECGKEYWTIVRRFNQHRETNPMIKPVAVREMIALVPRVNNVAVKRRIHSFIARHSPAPTNPQGPRYA